MKLAIRVGTAERLHIFVAVVTCFATLPSGAWSATASAPIVVNVGSISELCCLLVLDGKVHV